jgi:hypothetical protein
VVGRSVRASADSNDGMALEMLMKCYKNAVRDCREGGRCALLLKGKGTPRSQEGAWQSGR